MLRNRNRRPPGRLVLIATFPLWLPLLTAAVLALAVICMVACVLSLITYCLTRVVDVPMNLMEILADLVDPFLMRLTGREE